MLKYLISILLLGASFSALGGTKTIVEMIGGSQSGAVLNRAGKISLLHAGDSLEIGDKINTGKQTAVDIRLVDNTLVRIGVNSSFQLEQDTSGAIHRLWSGILRVLVPENKTGKADIRYRVSTPAGTIGVRGTEFVIQHEHKTSTVYGLRGEVLFGAKGDFSDLSKFQVVKKNFESSVSEGSDIVSKPKYFELSSFLKRINAEAFAPLASRQAGELTPREESASIGNHENVAASPSASSAKQTTADQKKTSAETPLQANADTMLLTGAANGDVAAMTKALAAGASANGAKSDDVGNAALHLAAINGKLEAIQFLIDSAHATVDIGNNKGQTPLMLAASQSPDPKAISLLLENGAKVNVKDKLGHNAFDYVNEKRNSKAITQILKEHSK